jgi:anaerobic selenocysteine-containing dehydrogenase
MRMPNPIDLIRATGNRKHSPKGSAAQAGGSPTPGTHTTTTFCRICEAMCGLTATVKDGELIQLRPNREHPISRGFACPKGILMPESGYDPDRLLHPLRRRAGAPRGAVGMEHFERVTWDEALDDIASRTRQLIDDHGGSAIGSYFGAAGFYSYSAPMLVQGFLDGIGSPHSYSSASQDASSRFAACALLYGSSLVVPMPDLYRTDFLVIIGANPLVTHGSLLNAGRIRDTLQAVVRRGGRVVVVDPRRTETAAAFEHLPVRPDSDAWMLLSILQVIFTHGLEDRAAIARQSRGVETLRELCAAYPPEATEELTGIPAEQLRELARDLATAPAAAVYGRCGTNRGTNPTLVAFLIEVLNLVTGNLDKEGGWLIGSSPVPDAFQKNFDSYGKRHSRIGGFPDVFGFLPAGVMAKEMLTPGSGRIRGFFTVAGNPILSVPNGEELARALSGLQLHVAVDLYLTETARFADYVLPATTFLERQDLTLLALVPWHLTPHVEWSEPVIAPRGETREEADIFDAIAQRAGIQPYSVGLLRGLARLGLRPSPKQLTDLSIRLGPQGDLFGLRPKGLSMKKLESQPNGVVLSDQQQTGVLRKRIRHADKLVRLDPPEIVAELRRLDERTRNPDYPLSLIGMRELKSLNSWMHNSRGLMGRRKHAARIHPQDAADAGIVEDDLVRVVSATNTITLPARLTDEVIRGTIAIPHGWGHQGGWQHANAHAGANVNLLASTRPEDIDALSGSAHLDGIPVRIEPANSDQISAPATT